MATMQFGWGDGTSDKITITYTGAVNSSDMLVASNPNQSLLQRTKIITCKSTMNGATIGTLTVSQKPRSRAFSAGFSTGFM